MFESLKKKLKNWLGTEREKKPKRSEKKEKTKNIKKGEKKKPRKEKEQSPIIESIKEKETEKKEGFFGKIFAKVSSKKITTSDFNELFYELELALLESNVALEVVDALKKELETRLVGIELKKESLVNEITKQLNESIKTLLKEPQDLLETIKKKQGIFTMLFFGINGSGKTTSVAKIAHYLKKNHISCVMAAGDTFRAASIEQLETHGQRIKIPVVKQQYGADPAAVAFDARKYAQAHGIKVVLIDTAGRMYTRDNLMKEMEKIVRISQPDLKLFVGEAITGNDATEQARMFNETAGIDGIILTKADVDDKGGTALSVSHVTQKPIYFLGMGQGYEDLKPFKKQDILKNLGLNE
ncbi:MAG: signal recognition particle-docking protein FtsY [Nanoarchaeota archaeon]